MKEKTCRVLLIGECFSNNLGDAIICDCVRYLLLADARVASVDVVDLSGRTTFQEEMMYRSKNHASFKMRLRNWFLSVPIPRFQSLFGWMLYQRKRRKQQQHEAYVKSVLTKPYDVAVFAGGQLFYEPFLVYLEHFQAQLAIKNIPIIFNACGYGPFKNRYVFERFGALLNHPSVKSISVRDHLDFVNTQWMKSAGKKAMPTVDPAVWCNEAYAETVREKRSMVGIGVIYIQDDAFMKKQTELVQGVVQVLEKEKIAFQLFGNGYISDDHYARDLAAAIGLDSEQVAARPTAAANLITLIGSFDVILSSRLHSHIVANGLHIPSVGIAWDEKIPEYFLRIEANDRCFNVDAKAGDIAKKILQLKIQVQDDLIAEDLKRLSRNALSKALDKVMT